MKVLMGKKIGMTRIYNENGKIIPVTVIEAGPVYITQIREENSATKVQIGYGNKASLNKPEKGHLDKQGVKKQLTHLQEIKADADNLKVGETIDVTSFAAGDVVDIVGTSKGKGFAGTIKRHGFQRGPKTHGSKNYRKPGSIGSGYPEHVFKGKRMAGHMGAERVTVKKLRVVEIHPEKNIIVVSGAVPGIRGSLLTIKGA